MFDDRNWITCWVCAGVDHYEVFETFEDAEAKYASIIKDGIPTASICAVIQSTDYSPHEAFR